MVRLTRLLRQDQELCRALDDEFVQQSRLKSFAASFWVVLAAQAAILGLAGFVNVSAAAAANIITFLGVNTAVASFLVLTRE